jgi:integrase/recombinase XerD
VQVLDKSKKIPLKQKQTNNRDKINEYLMAMRTEINPSSNYATTILNILNRLSQFYNGNKPFSKMKREDTISFLDSLRKTDIDDPLHKWVGTYNLYLTVLTRFFKWLYDPISEPKQRLKPEVMQNLHKLRRKETSIYKPTDLWTQEDDLLFLKWCPNKRDRCYFAISRDLSARPHEILDLRIKDIIFKQAGNKQYAEVLVNGKTGTRHLPLIDSLPYVKEWLDHHPQRNNPNAYFICTMFRRNIGGRMTRIGLLHIFTQRYKEFFLRLANDPTVSKEDKRKIGDLLRKPWNLYIRRHSSLTQKSKFLKENILRQHAGWTPNSNMHLKYVHFFGNESSESILQEYGILPKDNAETDILRPKQCPNCNEANKQDSKFCSKCRMVLTYDAYGETLESEKQKQDRLTLVEEQLSSTQQMLQQLISNLSKITDQQQINGLSQSLFNSGILKSSGNT